MWRASSWPQLFAPPSHGYHAVLGVTLAMHLPGSTSTIASCGVITSTSTGLMPEHLCTKLAMDGPIKVLTVSGSPIGVVACSRITRGGGGWSYTLHTMEHPQGPLFLSPCFFSLSLIMSTLTSILW